LFYPQITQIFTDYYLTFFLICVHPRNPRINKLKQRLPHAKLVLAESAGHWMGEKPVEQELLKAVCAISSNAFIPLINAGCVDGQQPIL
jgi:hypothetical protein